MVISPPDATEFTPNFGRYITLVKGVDALAALDSQIVETLSLLRPLSDNEALHRYEPGKWSIKEVVGHIIDTERIFAYRALRFARNDKTPLPGFEQDDYVNGADFDRCGWASLLDELEVVRRATVFLFRHLRPEALTRSGTASNNLMTARAFAYAIAGHELHHLKILRARYLANNRNVISA